MASIYLTVDPFHWNRSSYRQDRPVMRFRRRSEQMNRFPKL